jgi:hypothetical protein
MKNLFFIVVFVVFLTQWGSSQVTCPGATLTTQSEVNQYVADYPGCEVVTGSLQFYNSNGDPISDVSGLSSLIQIQGDFAFSSITSLTDISFNSLDSVFGTFSIDFQQGLNAISLNNLSYVQNTFRISNTLNQNNSLSVTVPNLNHADFIVINTIDQIDIPLLETCNDLRIYNVNTTIGFNEITNLNNLSINGNNVTGFNSLQSVNSTDLYIVANINGFNSLTTFPFINGLYNLESFIGFNAVTQINDNLTINSSTIDAFNGLTQVNGNISLNATNIAGFGALQSTQDLIINASGNIPQFNTLTSANYISISSPQAVSGFNIIQTAQDISITSAGDISGFSSLTNINENLVVSAQNISGFEAVENFNYIDINTQSLNGFNNLTSGNYLSITSPTITGFEHLTDLADGLSLHGQNINGFNFLTSCPNIQFLNASSIVGFNGLTSTGNLYFNESFQLIEGFNSLQNATHMLVRASQVKGFNALISGALYLQNNQIIEGFNSYTQPLNLYFNGQKIAGFNALPSGEHHIVADSIIGFNGLTSSSNLSLDAPYISGFNAIVTANQLGINTQNLSGFNTLTQADDIHITADDITGFNILTQTNNLNLTGDLNNFDAFALLATVNFDLRLQSQRSDYNIFPALQNVGSLYITNSPNFTGSAFFPLAQIKSFEIRDCSSLVNLDGLLPRSKYVGITLNNNSSLTDLTGLETVKNVVNLSISDNPSLTNIEALDSMRIIQGNLSLVNNTSLNECCVLAFIINRNKVFGIVEISGNAHDCEDIVMVLEETCLDSDEDGIADPQDNCPLANNGDQSDIDSDGVGDMCDNCIDIANPGQEDDNGDGIGNVCQPTAGTGFMDLNNSDLYITNNQRGVILKTRSGNCYRIRIDESGKVLSIPLLQCP